MQVTKMRKITCLMLLIFLCGYVTAAELQNEVYSIHSVDKDTVIITHKETRSCGGKYHGKISMTPAS